MADVLAVDYIVDPESKRLKEPLLVVSVPDPDDPSGQFVVIGQSDDHPWHAYAAAFDAEVAVLRPSQAPI